MVFTTFFNAGSPYLLDYQDIMSEKIAELDIANIIATYLRDNNIPPDYKDKDIVPKLYDMLSDKLEEYNKKVRENNDIVENATEMMVYYYLDDVIMVRLKDSLLIPEYSYWRQLDDNDKKCMGNFISEYIGWQIEDNNMTYDDIPSMDEYFVGAVIDVLPKQLPTIVYDPKWLKGEVQENDPWFWEK